MKVQTHGLFLIAVVLILILGVGSINGQGGIELIIELMGALVLIIVGIVKVRNQKVEELKQSGGKLVELRSTNIKSRAEYKYQGIFRRGELRLVDETLVFETAGLEDFGPYYKFSLDSIANARSETIQFSRDSLLILVMKSGSEEVFKVSSASSWLTAIERNFHTMTTTI